MYLDNAQHLPGLRSIESLDLQIDGLGLILSCCRLQFHVQRDRGRCLTCLRLRLVLMGLTQLARCIKFTTKIKFKNTYPRMRM
jgi:hypothetical protein